LSVGVFTFTSPAASITTSTPPFMIGKFVHSVRTFSRFSNVCVSAVVGAGRHWLCGD